MKFIYPQVLFLLWLIPALVLFIIWGNSRRKKILLNFANIQSLKKISPNTSLKRRIFKYILLITATVCLIFAICGIQYGYRWEQVQRKGISIIVALDCSKSMLAKDILPSRLQRAKREIKDLLTMLQGDKIGLVAFAGTAFMQCPLTMDYSAFDLFLNHLSPDYLPVGGSNLDAALQAAMSGFEKDNGEKAIILITDGENTGPDPMPEAKQALEQGIKIFCIGVGDSRGAPIPDGQGGFKKDESGKIVLSKPDPAILTKISELTGGLYVPSVSGDMDLERIYEQQIRKKMKQQTLESGRKQIFIDRFQWLVGLAVLALFMETILPAGRKKIISLLILSAFSLTNLPAPAQAAPGKAQQGLSAYQKQDYEQAQKHLVQAQIARPDDPSIIYDLGNTYYRLGQFKQAEDYFSQIVKNEKAEPKLKQDALFNLGNSQYRQQQLQKAITSYEQLLKINPQAQDAKNNIEYIKKIMQKQKQQKKQQEHNNKQKKQDKKSNSEKKQKNQDQGKDKQNKSCPNPRMQQSDKKQEQQQKSSFADKMNKNQLKQEQKQSPQPTPAQKQAADEKKFKDKPQASMLNRLKDLPGKPMTGQAVPGQIGAQDW